MTDVKKQYVVDFASMDGNGTPDWAKVKEVADGVYMRAAHGATADPTFRELAQGARDAGLVVGAYGIIEWWAGAAPIAAQAAALLAELEAAAKPGDMPASMDVEFGNGRPAGLSATDALARAEAYAKAIIAARGFAACYTSSGQWADNLGGARSAVLTATAGWFKTGYYVREHNAMAPASQGPCGHAQTPTPWQAPGSAGGWLQQFQGDAWGFGGLKQCDVSAFLPASVGEWSERVRWLQRAIGAVADGTFGPVTEAAVRALQGKADLPETGAVDLATWVAICEEVASAAMK